MMIKKKNITQVLVKKNFIKNFKNGALSRYLIKSIKKYFIKNLIKNFKKAPYQKINFIKKLKNVKTLIKNLKKCLIKVP